MYAQYVLDCLSLIVLLPSRLKKVYLTRCIIEPIENSGIVGAYRIEQRVFSFDIFDQEGFMLDWIKNM